MSHRSSSNDLDFSKLASERALSIDASGIRRMFELASKVENPINLSIGQPDFPVPRPIKDAVIQAIEDDRNGYTVTKGDAHVLQFCEAHLQQNVGWSFDDGRLDMMMTSGTSGGLVLAALSTLEAGDELIIPDPWFVLYPKLGALTGATVVPCDTYPDFRLTAERVESLITERTKAVLLASPGNPTGVVLSESEVRELVELCRDRGLLLISDEIYDEFTFADHLVNGLCPSPAHFWDQVLLIRGLGKTYGCTGWRLGYAAGPSALIAQMAKLQQFTYVCAPSMAQHAFEAMGEVSIAHEVERYAARRDLIMQRLGDLAVVSRPGGAFYAFIEVPEHLGLTGTQFAEAALQHGLLVVPGAVFSDRDTHFRISFAVPDEVLEKGLSVLEHLLKSG